MIQANINDRYAQLSQQEKAELIGIYTRAGYRDLASIIAHYNSCGGKLHASGGPVTNTARYRDDSYLYNPPVNVGAPIETPLRYRPLPDYGNYQPQRTSGMIEEIPIDLNIEIPERGYGVLLPEEPITVPALDARKDAARRIMAVENSKNNVNGGYDAKTGRWYPHKSHEGGADTIAYGIKLSNGTPEAALALKQGYLTDEQAVNAVDTLVQKYYNDAKKVYDKRFGEGEWDKLSDKSQSILVDYSYNPGLSKFTKLMDAFHSGDKDGILKEYKRYSGKQELGRNKTLFEEIQTLGNEYSIFRAEGGRLYGDGGENKYPTSSTVSYLRGLADYALRRKTPRSFVESGYRPTLGDNGETFYTRPGLKNEVVLNLFGGSDYGKGLLGENYFYKDFDDAYNSISGHPMNRDMRATSNGTLGQYSVTAGADDRGRYLSFTDKFDHIFIPGDPIHIYDRIYEDEVPLLYNAGDSAIGLGDALSRSPLLKDMKASGGKIHIKPENRGKFTALKKRTGHSASWFKAHGTPAQKKMATFALNARKWKHEDGGLLNNYLYDGGPYGIIPLGGDYLTYLQTIPEVSGGSLEPALVTAPLPAKFNGSQATAARYAEGYKKGAKPVSEAMNRAGQDIFNAVDTVVGLTPTPAGAISWLGHMGADTMNGEYGKVGKDLAMAAAMGLGLKAIGKGATYLKNYWDEIGNFGEDTFRAFTDSDFKTYKTPKTQYVPIEYMEPIASSATNNYQIDDLGGGYMLKSLMRGNPLEKQISKQGTVNVNNVKAFASKESKVEQAVIDKVLASEEFAGKKAIDYNKFRKAVQDELITYERTPNTGWNDYGVDRLGISSYMDAAESPEMRNKFNEFIMNNFSWNPVSDEFYIPGDPSSKSFSQNDLAKMFFEDGPGVLDVPVGVAKKLDTFTFSSPRIPNGSGKHYNPNTLGHSRTYTTTDEPNILHVMESQSDWAQNRGFMKPSNQFEIEQNKAANRLRIKYMQEHPSNADWVYYDKNGNIELPFESQLYLESDYPGIEEYVRKNLSERQNPYVADDAMADYLHDNFTSRQIQENLRYAAENGQTKMRYPTRETAAKIEGYQKSRSQTLQDNPELQKQYDELRDALKAEEDRIVKKYAPEDYLDESLREADFGDMGLSEEETERLLDQIQRSEQFERSADGAKMREEIIEARERMDPDKWLRENVEEKYIPQYETILKKYDAFPKQYKKIYKNTDVRVVTDPKGNTWYEVDVPENYLQQEWTYKNGGRLKEFNSISSLF